MPAPAFRASRRQLLDLDGEGRQVEIDGDHRRRLRDLIARPEITYRLFVEGGGQRLAVDGWANHRTVALQTEVDPDQIVTVVAGELALLPSAIADAVGLGPRPDPTAAQAVVGRDELRDALARGEPLDGLGPITTVWTLRWVEGATPGEGLTVIDGGPGHPMWVTAGVDGDAMLLRDEGSLAVWLHLAELLSLPAASGSPASEADLDDAVVAAE